MPEQISNTNSCLLFQPMLSMDPTQIYRRLETRLKFSFSRSWSDSTVPGYSSQVQVPMNNILNYLDKYFWVLLMYFSNTSKFNTNDVKQEDMSSKAYIYAKYSLFTYTYITHYWFLSSPYTCRTSGASKNRDWPDIIGSDL